MRVTVIGGTGKEGRGLAARWAAAGHEVVLGSRDGARAAAVAEELAGLIGQAQKGTKGTMGPGGGGSGVSLRGAENAAALEGADVVLLSVPYSAHKETLRGLQAELLRREGRILIDITVPLRPPQVAQVHLPEGQSAALEAQELLGPAVKVVAALHHVSSTHLLDLDKHIDCDVLVCGDDAAAKSTVIQLVKDLGLRGLDAGALRNAIALESLTPVLLALNKRYKSSGAGIRFTNIDVG
ncbi:MAG: NADPH-dependent F420 reductase [Polyangia bacterium]